MLESEVVLSAMVRKEGHVASRALAVAFYAVDDSEDNEGSVNNWELPEEVKDLSMTVDVIIRPASTF